MTEAEWLTSADPEKMLAFLSGKVNDRKLRLFACACCRRLWPFLTDPRSRRALAVAEAYADGEAGDEALRIAEALARDAWKDPAGAAACDVVQAYAPAAATLASNHVSWAGRENLRATELAVNARLLRDVFGNPFCSVALEPSWLSWGGGCVRAMARAIYDERRFDDLLVLADALEDAGCTDEAILSHCRQEGPHVRGCWVLDLLLGKG